MRRCVTCRLRRRSCTRRPPTSGRCCREALAAAPADGRLSAAGVAAPATQPGAGQLLPLALRVVHDTVRSNLAVARVVLGPRRRARAGFVAIPLELADPYGLALLACIVTSTPGTIWVDHDPMRGVLLIHVLDLVDEASWVETIKRRYERPLLEVFQ